MRKELIGALGIVAAAGAAGAEPFEGTKTLTLEAQNGAQVVVGTVQFSGEGPDFSYRITWDLGQFGDYFLSMRPFKCLDGADKLWCRVPYPYEIARRVSGADLTDLEYDTLFVWKRSGDYGIDLWNGIYYRLDVTESGLVGRLHEIDLGVLSAPPDAGDLRPVGPFDIEPGDPSSHAWPVLRIE